jgi:hypothetical protein
MRNRYPELNVDDDEALSDQISSDYDLLDQRDQERKQFNDLLAQNPYAAPIVTGMATGKKDDGTPFDLGEFLIDEYPEMIQDLIEGNPDTKKHYEESRDARRQAAADEEQFAAELESKTQAEDAELDAAVKEMGYKPEEVAELIRQLYDPDNGLIRRAARFELTKDDFLMLFKILNYDADIKRADNDGYVRGKNEKIDMLEHQQGKRGRLPVIGSGGGRPSAKEPDPTLDNLDRMKHAYTI